MLRTSAMESESMMMSDCGLQLQISDDESQHSVPSIPSRSPNPTSERHPPLTDRELLRYLAVRYADMGHTSATNLKSQMHIGWCRASRVHKMFLSDRSRFMHLTQSDLSDSDPASEMLDPACERSYPACEKSGSAYEKLDSTNGQLTSTYDKTVSLGESNGVNSYKTERRNSSCFTSRPNAGTTKPKRSRQIFVTDAECLKYLSDRLADSQKITANNLRTAFRMGHSRAKRICNDFLRDNAGSARDNAGSVRDNAGSVRDNAGSARDSVGSARDNAGPVSSVVIRHLDNIMCMDDEIADLEDHFQTGGNFFESRKPTRDTVSDDQCIRYLVDRTASSKSISANNLMRTLRIDKKRARRIYEEFMCEPSSPADENSSESSESSENGSEPSENGSESDSENGSESDSENGSESDSDSSGPVADWFGTETTDHTETSQVNAPNPASMSRPTSVPNPASVPRPVSVSGPSSAAPNSLGLLDSVMSPVSVPTHVTVSNSAAVLDPVSVPEHVAVLDPGSVSDNATLPSSHPQSSKQDSEVVDADDNRPAKRIRLNEGYAAQMCSDNTHNSPVLCSPPKTPNHLPINSPISSLTSQRSFSSDSLSTECASDPASQQSSVGNPMESNQTMSPSSESPLLLRPMSVSSPVSSSCVMSQSSQDSLSLPGRPTNRVELQTITPELTLAFSPCRFPFWDPRMSMMHGGTANQTRSILSGFNEPSVSSCEKSNIRYGPVQTQRSQLQIPQTYNGSGDRNFPNERIHQPGSLNCSNTNFLQPGSLYNTTDKSHNGIFADMSDFQENTQSKSYFSNQSGASGEILTPKQG
eukprot:203040_1